MYKGFTWGSSGSTVYYACANSVIVNDSAKTKNYVSLNKHTDRVNFVRAANNFKDRQVIVSGGSDSLLVVWESSNESVLEVTSWSVKGSVNLAHSVSFAAVYEFGENIAYILAGNILGDVYFLKLDD